MFAIVFLKDVKIYIIVAEEWLYDINPEFLRNRGKNWLTTKDLRVFFSSIGMNNGIPDSTYEPKFHLPISNIFPPQNEEACYCGRIKEYIGSKTKFLAINSKSMTNIL